MKPLLLILALAITASAQIYQPRARFYELYICRCGVGVLTRSHTLRWVGNWSITETGLPIYITNDRRFCGAEVCDGGMK